jgi:hypothetical protein
MKSKESTCDLSLLHGCNGRKLPHFGQYAIPRNLCDLEANSIAYEASPAAPNTVPRRSQNPAPQILVNRQSEK